MEKIENMDTFRPARKGSYGAGAGELSEYVPATHFRRGTLGPN